MGEHDQVASAGWARPASQGARPVALNSIVSDQMQAPPPGPLRGSPLHRLQARTVGQLADAAFEVVRFRMNVVLAVVSCVVLPFTAIPILVATLNGDLVDRTELLTGQFGSSLFRLNNWPSALALVGSAIGQMLCGVGIAHAVGSWAVGVDPSVSQVLRHILKRAPVAAGAYLVVLVPKALGFLACYVGVIASLAFFSLLAPVVGAETFGVYQSIRRATSLGRSRWGVLMVLCVISLVVSSLGALLAFVLPYEIGDVLGIPEAVPWITAVVSTIGSGLSFSFVASVSALAYVDARVRSEGLDLQLCLAERIAT